MPLTAGIYFLAKIRKISLLFRHFCRILKAKSTNWEDIIDEDSGLRGKKIALKPTVNLRAMLRLCDLQIRNLACSLRERLLSLLKANYPNNDCYPMNFRNGEFEWRVFLIV